MCLGKEKEAWGKEENASFQRIFFLFLFSFSLSLSCFTAQGRGRFEWSLKRVEKFFLFFLS